MLIRSTFSLLGEFPATWPDEVVKNEPMLFNCDRAAAERLGGPVTRAFLQNLPDHYRNQPMVVDSRVHMLMPGWFPCIPGYHHDDVPRSGRDQQPNYISPEYRSDHIMGLVNGEIAPTEFALGAVDLEIPETGIIYKHWHPRVVDAIQRGDLQTFSAPSGVYIRFDDRTFHQGVRATRAGWRYFIRVSFNTDRVKKCTNEIRRQVQVYLEYPMEGW